MFSIKNVLQKFFTEYREYTDIPEEDFSRIMKEVEKRVENEPPPKVALIGDTGVGKSSTINALFNAGRSVSHTQAETQEEAAIEINIDNVEGENGALIVYDMPGLSESLGRRTKHLHTYERVLKDVDVALWILDAQHRAMEHIQSHLKNEIASINPELVDRMVFALNKVDLVHPGSQAWHPLSNLPSEAQEENIQARIADVKQKIKSAIPSWDGTIIGYSAEKRYNLPQLFSVMLDSVPEERQWVLTSRKAIADFLELVHPSLLPEDRRPENYIRNDRNKKNESSNMEEILQQLPDEEFAKIPRTKEEFLKWFESQKKSGSEENV